MNSSAENLLHFALDDKHVTTRGELNRWVVTDAMQDLGGRVIVVVRGGAEETREEEVANEKAAHYHG